MKKCGACGYEYKGEWNRDGYVNIIGDEKFIQIFSDHKFKIENTEECHHGDYDYESTVTVELYACPKCNMILMV